MDSELFLDKTAVYTNVPFLALRRIFNKQKNILPSHALVFIVETIKIYLIHYKKSYDEHHYVFLVKTMATIIP